MLVDSYNRLHTYLSIAVTNRCNMRCLYCSPNNGPFGEEQYLTFDEVEHLAALFVKLGVRTIRLTGGEPLLRKNIELLAYRLARLEGLKGLTLATNGITLHQKVAALKLAGVHGISIKLDSLRNSRHRAMSSHYGYDEVIRSICEVLRIGFPVLSVNTVIVRGFNDDEFADFVEFAARWSLPVRFKEFMPYPGNHWDGARFVGTDEMIARVSRDYHLIPVQETDGEPMPLQRYRVTENNAEIAFVSTGSNVYCQHCRRILLTPDGRLRVCLYDTRGLDLKSLLRTGADDVALSVAIQAYLRQKWQHRPALDVLAKSQTVE